MLNILYEIQTSPDSCSYLPEMNSSLRARWVVGLDASTWGQLLSRGWRRFGVQIFRPQCPRCRSCRPIRVDVNHFVPSKSQRRLLKKNEHLRVELGAPRVSKERISLFNDYHAYMTESHNWPENQTDRDDYQQSFLAGKWSFAREMRYYADRRLVGVSLIDVVPDAMSSIYFYHAPDWRPLGPGTFSILQELQLCQELGLRYLYLGYWIERCPSMAYKSRFLPHELLERIVDLDEEPTWIAPSGNADSNLSQDPEC